MSPNKIMLFCADSSKTQMITTCLSKSDYKVVQAAHGIGALDAIHTERPNLIILDFKLPGMNSLAIIRNLRSEK
jgi:two-component system response regulator (stage 0 sporulation protein F)